MALQIGALHIDEPRQRASLGGRRLALRPLDLRLLVHLARASDRALPRRTLAQALWGDESTVDARGVDACVKRIRRALDGSADAIVTVRRVGYRLDPDRLRS